MKPSTINLIGEALAAACVMALPLVLLFIGAALGLV
jgi:hypothetical protein